MVYRNIKGAPLTLEELDGNFRELEARMASQISPSFSDNLVEYSTKSEIDYVKNSLNTRLAELESRVLELENRLNGEN